MNTSAVLCFLPEFLSIITPCLCGSAASSIAGLREEIVLSAEQVLRLLSTGEGTSKALPSTEA